VTRNNDQLPDRAESAPVRAWIWPVALAATIFFCSGNGKVAGPTIENFDKLAHFLIFGLLGTLVARCSGLVHRKPLGLATAVVIVSLYGVLDEYHQSFTPGRSVSAVDWMADTLGAALAVTLYARWKNYRLYLEWPDSMPEIETATRTDSTSQP
jgi:VanZ family protein